MRKLLIRVAFHQAREDGVTLLEIGEDVWGLSEYFHNDVDELIEVSGISEWLAELWQELGISAGTAIVVLAALYFMIKWAVKNGMMEAYKKIEEKRQR